MLDVSVDSNVSGSSVDSSFAGEPVADKMEDEAETRQLKEEQARQQRHKRLIDWNVDMLTRLLKQMAAQRKAGKASPNFQSLSLLPQPGTSTVDEVKEIIYLGGAATAKRGETTELDPDAISQLRYYVSSVCAMYHDNPCESLSHRL